jgi:hypothetical protein
MQMLECLQDIHARCGETRSAGAVRNSLAERKQCITIGQLLGSLFCRAAFTLQELDIVQSRPFLFPVASD